MNDVAKAAYSLLCAFLFVVFMLATMLSVMVLLGMVGDNPLAGLFCTVVFWIAASKYKKLFIERIETIQKNIQPPDDNDESDDTV
jgi:hypothetical protein